MASGTVLAFASIASVSFMFKASLSRGFVAVAVPVGLVLLLARSPADPELAQQAPGARGLPLPHPRGGHVRRAHGARRDVRPRATGRLQRRGRPRSARPAGSGGQLAGPAGRDPALGAHRRRDRHARQHPRPGDPAPARLASRGPADRPHGRADPAQQLRSAARAAAGARAAPGAPRRAAPVRARSASPRAQPTASPPR